MRSAYVIFSLLIASSYATDPLPLIIYGGLGNNGHQLEVAQLRRVLTQEMGYASEDAIAFYATDLYPGMPINAVGACDYIKGLPQFQNATEYNVIGVSQGGMNARSVLEECEMGAKIRNLITLGTPNMGITQAGADFPDSDQLTEIGYYIGYFRIVQYLFAPAGYFRDTRTEKDFQNYLKYSKFLPRINNENDQTSADAQSRKQRMINLNKYLAVCFDNDQIVFPRESACFSELDVPNSSGDRQLVTMEDTDLYKQDYIGLKTLNENGKLSVVHMPGGHVQFTDDEIRTVMVPILKS